MAGNKPGFVRGPQHMGVDINSDAKVPRVNKATKDAPDLRAGFAGGTATRVNSARVTTNRKRS